MAKILLVEDNEMNRDMLSRRLERRGYQVVIAVDGVEPYDMRDARERLSGPVNSDVVVEVWRNEATHRLTLTREAVRR